MSTKAHVSYKIAVIGPKMSGKSAYISRIAIGAYPHEYRPTDDIRSTMAEFNTYPASITCQLIEIPDGKKANFYVDGVIVFLNGDKSQAAHYIDKAKELASASRISVCRSFADCETRTPLQILLLSYPIHQISARNNSNLDAPILHLLKLIREDPNLTFTELPAIDPPTIRIPTPHISAIPPPLPANNILSPKIVFVGSIDNIQIASSMRPTKVSMTYEGREINMMF